MVFSSFLPLTLLQLDQVVERSDSYSSYNVLYSVSFDEYYIFCAPFLVHMSIDDTTLCVYHLNPMLFTLNYTQCYVDQHSCLQKWSNVSRRFMNRIDACFSSPDKRLLVLLADVEWWSSNNRAVVVSIVRKEGREVRLIENVMVIDCQETIRSSSMQFSFYKKELFLLPSLKSHSNLFICHLQLPPDVSKKNIYKQRIDLKLTNESIFLPLRHMVALDDKHILFQNKDGIMIYSLERYKLGCITHLPKQSLCGKVDYDGNALIVCASFSEKSVIISVFVNKDNALHIEDTFTCYVQFTDKDVSLLKIKFSVFLGLRLYLLFSHCILVIDMLNRTILAHLRFSDVSSDDLCREMHISRNGREVVCMQLQCQKVEVFYLGVEIFSKLTLKYLAGSAVRKFCRLDKIEDLSIPARLKQYLLI